MADLSFLPEDYLERRIQRRTNLISLTLFLIVICGLFGALIITNRTDKEVTTSDKQIDARYREAANKLEKLDKLQESKQQMIHKAQVTGVLVEKVPRSLVLAELVNNMPLTMSLTDLSLETSVTQRRPSSFSAIEAAKKANKQAGKPAEEEIVPTDVSLQISGLAMTDLDVAQLMAQLHQSQLFESVSLTSSEQIMVKEDSMRKFQVEARLNQEINLKKFKPTVPDRGIKANPMDRKAVGKEPVPMTVYGNPGGEPTPTPASDAPSRKSLKE